MSYEQLVEAEGEVKDYHPTEDDKPRRITPGIYVIRRIDFGTKPEFGEFANIEADEGRFYTFSQVLIPQLRKALQVQQLPIRVEVKQVKKYFTLV